MRTHALRPYNIRDILFRKRVSPESLDRALAAAARSRVPVTQQERQRRERIRNQIVSVFRSVLKNELSKRDGIDTALTLARVFFQDSRYAQWSERDRNETLMHMAVVVYQAFAEKNEETCRAFLETAWWW